MRKWLEKLTHNPLLSAIAAALVTLIGSQFFNILNRSDIKYTLDFLAFPVVMSRWVFGVLIIGFLFAVVIILGPLLKRIVSNKVPSESTPNWYRNYKKDEIEDVRWRWFWHQKYYPSTMGIKAYCLKCDIELSLEAREKMFKIDGDFLTLVALSCPDHGDQSDFIYDDTYSNIGKEIEKRARAM